jgi:HAD superfamily hydrolase (TIGR01509 family)
LTRGDFRFSTVLFDWDGTLLDSARLGLVAFRATFHELGIPFRDELYQTTYSPNWYAMYKALNVPRECWEEADRLWLQHYGDEPPGLVEGALQTLLALSARGYRMGVVSSGSESRVRREICSLGLAGHFGVVICNESTRNKKPHPEGLELAMAAIGCGPGECCYVGDSPEDIAMGRSAGIYTIGVPGGYPGSARLASACPDLLLSSVQELLVHL